MKAITFRLDKIRTFGILGLCLLFFGSLNSQTKSQEREALKLAEETLGYLSEANDEISDDNFVGAEANYRKAIAISPSEEIGKYNLGNAYYNKEKNEEAMRRFAQAASISESKPEKHRAFHNLGNTFMNAKKYQEAVEAYKSALRNDPTDDETRYNLALAKEMLEKNPPQGDGEDENEDQKEKEDENQENKEDEGKEKESDDGKEKEDEGDGEDKEDKKDGEDKEKEGQPDEPKDEKENQGEDKKDPKQQPVPGQLSPQQIKNLLEAMNNEEKKVQDKINAKKQKGAKVKSNKDW